MFVLDFKSDRGYSYGQTSVGKSVSLLPTDPRKGTTAWHPSIGPFKPGAHFFYSLLILAFYILLLLFIICTNKSRWPSGSQVGVKAWEA